MSHKDEVWGVIVAVGRGQQMLSGAETAFLGIGSRPALAHSLSAFEHAPEVNGMIVVTARERMEATQAIIRRYSGGKPARVVAGFQSHRASLRAGVQALDMAPDWIVVHDAARPCVTPAMISAVLAAARRYGQGITAARVQDSIVVTQARALRAETLCEGEATWQLQTPQGFKRELLSEALRAADQAKLKSEDPAAGLPLIKQSIRLVPCLSANIRLSTPDDLALAATLLA